MKALISPNLLFPTEEIWNDPQSRDEFIENLTLHIDAIKDKEIIKIYWSDQFAEFFGTYIFSPLWMKDKIWCNLMFSGIYRYFISNFEILDFINTDDLTACNINPFHLSCIQDVDEAFLTLAHKVIDNNEAEEVFLCLGRYDKRELYTFSCDCHDDELLPKPIADPDDWMMCVDPLDFWPAHGKDKENLKKAIEVFLFQESKKKQEVLTVVYPHYDFTENFIKEILYSVDAKLILEQLCKRLTLIQSYATRDQSLHDEPVKGKEKEGKRRFRVSQVSRIHYHYDSSGGLLFDRYFPRGKYKDAF